MAKQYVSALLGGDIIILISIHNTFSWRNKKKKNQVCWVSYNEKGQFSLSYPANFKISIWQRVKVSKYIGKYGILSFKSNKANNFTYSMPCAVCRPISISPNISNFTSSTWRCLYKLEPSHHWVIIASWGLNVQPINNNIFTCRVFLKNRKKHVSTHKFIWAPSSKKMQINPVHVLSIIQAFALHSYTL